MTDPDFYLASASPRRRELLAQLGLQPQLLPLAPERAVDETPQPGEPPLVYVKRLARAKALAGLDELDARGWSPAPVLGADTTVALGAQIFGKPADTTEAEQMLLQLSGRAHQVLTAVALALPGPAGPQVDLRVSVSTVRLREVPIEEARAYVASGEPFDKAGAYGIQGRAAAFIAHLEGSYSGVMGLPLFETADLLAQSGIGIWKES